MNYHLMLQQTLVYIDAHLMEEITCEQLAAMNGFSATHFSHVFRFHVGYPVMQYLRLRRLLYAASELGSNKRIIDIAMDYGFETHSGFSKAFRRYFKCNPETYAQHPVRAIPALPALQNMKEYVPGGIIMEPRFITLPPVTIAGYTLTTTDTEGENSISIPAFWTAYLTDGRMKRLHSEGFLSAHAEYGVCFPVNSETGTFDYMIGVIPKEGAHISEEYDVRTIPAATYAVFSSPASVREAFVPSIQGTWQFIYNEWFPACGYEYAPGCVDFELYDERCMGDKDLVCDIYIPVIKA